MSGGPVEAEPQQQSEMGQRVVDAAFRPVAHGGLHGAEGVPRQQVHERIVPVQQLIRGKVQVGRDRLVDPAVPLAGLIP